MQQYLNSSPERAAKVAHYVNLDGATAAAPPGGVPTLAIWGQGSPARKIVDATNLYLSEPDPHADRDVRGDVRGDLHLLPRRGTGHHERCSRGPRPAPALRPGGRLPAEHRASSARSRSTRSTARPVDVWTSSPRRRSRCRGTEAGGRSARGRGPTTSSRSFARDHRRTTSTSSRSCGATPGSVCSRPSRAGSPTWPSAATNHSGMVILRYKEWWGDQGTNNDILEVNGVNILNAGERPQSKRGSVPSCTTPGWTA